MGGWVGVGGWMGGWVDGWVDRCVGGHDTVDKTVRRNARLDRIGKDDHQASATP